MRRIFPFIIFILLIFITGCGDKSPAVSKSEAFKYNDSSIDLSRETKTLNITIDSGNLQIYCWDKKNIESEVKHIVRDNKEREELEELLNKYSIKAEEKEGTLHLIVDYDGRIKNFQDVYSDLKLTIPKQIKKINIFQKNGSLILNDKFEGNIEAKLESVNTEIKSMKGQLLYECVNGNLRFNSGKLSDQSLIDISSGNIYLKAECQEKSKYSFNTENGNIDLYFPIDSKVSIESSGTVTNNQFNGVEGNIEIEVATIMGKISVNGY